MSSDVQEQIISAIFERRPIWNSKDVNHKNRRIINQLWEEIKNELNIEDFEYVVTQKALPRICFGTGLEREVLPMSGPDLSPFMRRMATEIRANLGPGTYENNRDAFYDLTSRIYSTCGVGAKTSRWLVKHEYQPPIKELPKPKPSKQNCAPFNSTSYRKPLFKASEYPATPECEEHKHWLLCGDTNFRFGPFKINKLACDYNPLYKKRELKFNYCFSDKKALKCAVQIKCVPYNLDACGVCGCLCTLQGDYWQFEDRIFLCRKHYNRLFKHCLSKYQGARLSEFKSVRDCFFAHAHNSCKAALKIMSIEEITKKLRKEAYLDLYFPQRRFCDH